MAATQESFIKGVFQRYNLAVGKPQWVSQYLGLECLKERYQRLPELRDREGPQVATLCRWWWDLWLLWARAGGSELPWSFFPFSLCSPALVSISQTQLEAREQGNHFAGKMVEMWRRDVMGTLRYPARRASLVWEDRKRQGCWDKGFS